MRSALLILDMQKGILRKNVFESRRLIDHVNMAISAFDQKQLPVILSRHTNTSSLKSETDSWQLSSDVYQPPQAIFFDKSRSNIFMENGFIQMLLQQNVERLYIGGLVTNGCVQAACISAHERGFSTVLLSDAHSTFVKDAATVVSKWNSKLNDLGIEIIPAQTASSDILGG